MVLSRGGKWMLVAVALVAGGLYAAGERPPTGRPNHDEQHAGLMLAKLAASQKIVSGLVSEDFDEIRRGAAELDRICGATEWAAHGDQIYGHHRTELRRQAQKLSKLRSGTSTAQRSPTCTR
jgi:hypothetical protein